MKVAVSSSRLTRAFVGTLLAMALTVSGLALIVPGLAAPAHAQTPPTTCPPGTTLVGGTCLPPGTTPTCPRGSTLTGGLCVGPTTRPLCPFSQLFSAGACHFLVPAAGPPCIPPAFAFSPIPGLLGCVTIGRASGFTPVCLVPGTTLTAAGCAPPGTTPTCAAGLTLMGGLCFPAGTAPTCPPGETLTNGLCVAPAAASPQPQAPGFSFAIGGQGGYTEPCDPGTCPTGQGAAAEDNAPAVSDDFTPPSSSTRSDDTASDDVLSEALGAG
jgi:hypothetical protein